MIAPGLDSSITAVSVRFFSTWSIPHWFAMDTAEFARNPFDNSRFTNCWNFWCQPRWPAARGLLLCHTMLAMLCIRSQPMFACHKDAVRHKCILYPSVGLRLTNAFPSFKTVFNVFSQNKVLLWVGSQDAKGEFWAGEELHACLLGLDMTPWTGNNFEPQKNTSTLHYSETCPVDMSQCNVIYSYSSAAQSCGAYWPTELIMFGVLNHMFFFEHIWK